MRMRKKIIGVMGPGKTATREDLQNAEELGKQIAQQGWILLTGGKNIGVMNAASQGAKSANGLTIGILPNQHTTDISAAVDIAIFTDMGNARNNINVNSSDVVVACGIGVGTASEISLALKANKKVIMWNNDSTSQAFFSKLQPDDIYIVHDCSAAIAIIQSIFNQSTNT